MALALLRIATLVVKEFLAIMKDPKSRVVVIGPPIIQFFVFGYAATFDLNNVRYAVRDEDRSVESRELLSRFRGSPTFRLVGELSSDREVGDLIDRQGVRLVLHIPQTFSRDLHAGRPAQVQVIVDGRNSNVAAVALGYASGIIAQYNAERGGTLAAGAPNAARPTLQLVDRAWFNPNLQSRWFIVSALGGLIAMIVVLLLSSLSVSREREFGTFDQLLVAPFRSGEILLAKALPPMVCGLFDALLLAAAAVLWFGLPFRGSLPALVVALSVFIVSVVGVGLFISSLSSTMQQSLLGSFMFIMPSVILSGFTTPIQNMPQWLQWGTLINPLRYIVTACREVFLQGGTLATIWPQLWPMAVIAAATLASATWLFRHRTA
ncbi:MAG: ABC transporter permease [Planctomycetaceae bacterium]|nr:ABC transporter permease [Planctomycetaceae bacterium]